MEIFSRSRTLSYGGRSYWKKRPAERAESQISKLSELQVNGKKLEDELSFWKSLMKEIPGVTSAADIPLKFEALHNISRSLPKYQVGLVRYTEVLEGMMKMGEVSARLKKVEVGLDAAENARKNAETESALTKEKVELLKLELKRTELLLSSVTEERDHLKTVVSLLKQQKNAEAGAATTDGNS